MKITTPLILTELFHLRKGDVELLIESTAVPYLLVEQNKWVGYIPTLNSSFVSDETHHITSLKENIEKYPLTSSLEGSVIKLDFLSDNIPASSMLFGKKWVNEIIKYVDLDENTYLLASSRTDMPVFCGHKTLIERLSTNFSGDIYIIQAQTLLEVKNVLG